MKNARPSAAGRARRAKGRGGQLGDPIAAEKKQRTWPGDPVRGRFAFSKPVLEGLIRENAFEIGNQERELCEIARSQR
jgi:hypothetical protein